MAIVNFDELWDYNNPAQTRVKFKKLLSDFVKESAKIDSILQLKTQIARTHSLIGEFKEAHAILDEVEAELPVANDLTKIRFQLEKGRTLNSEGNTSLATTHFLSAYDICDGKHYDNFFVDVLHMLAIVTTDIEQKEIIVEQGVALATNSKDARVKKWIGIFHNNLGWDLFEAEFYNQAMEQFKKCEEIYRLSENKVAQNIARFSIAKCLRLLGQHKKALKIQEKLLSENGGHDETGNIYEELAELNLSLEVTDVARNYFKRAYDILSQDPWVVENEQERISRLKGFSIKC